MLSGNQLDEVAVGVVEVELLETVGALLQGGGDADAVGSTVARVFDTSSTAKAMWWPRETTLLPWSAQPGWPASGLACVA